MTTPPRPLLPAPEEIEVTHKSGAVVVLQGYSAKSMHTHAAAVSAVDNAALTARVKVLERMVIDAAYALDKARIWNGMGWTYNPLHPIHYTPMREKLRNECDNIEAARSALEETK